MATYDSQNHWTHVSLDIYPVCIGIGLGTHAELSSRASVQIASLDSSNRTTFAYSLRSPIGLAFHSINKDLYVGYQERDKLDDDGDDDDLLLDSFTRIEENSFYRWLYVYPSPNLTNKRYSLENGTYNRPDLVSMSRTSDVLFEAHSAVSCT